MVENALLWHQCGNYWPVVGMELVCSSKTFKVFCLWDCVLMDVRPWFAVGEGSASTSMQRTANI